MQQEHLADLKCLSTRGGWLTQDEFGLLYLPLVHSDEA
jgi:hypothetical protein